MEIIRKANIDANNTLNMGNHILTSDDSTLFREVFICTYLDCKASIFMIDNASISTMQNTLMKDNTHGDTLEVCYWTGDTGVSGDTPTKQELIDWNALSGDIIFSGDTEVLVPYITILSGDTVENIIKKLQDEDIYFKNTNIIL